MKYRKWKKEMEIWKRIKMENGKVKWKKGNLKGKWKMKIEI
jgi:hypothetical protein